MSDTIVDCRLRDLEVGMSATLEREIAQEDIVAFAELTGDDNPVHLDAEYARNTFFESRIAHGMLSASLISAVLGTRLPGPGTIYLSQSLFFRAPVRPGDRVAATVSIAEIDRKRRKVLLACVCRVGATTVLDGEARVLLPVRPDSLTWS